MSHIHFDNNGVMVCAITEPKSYEGHSYEVLDKDHTLLAAIDFQKGAVADVGVNGVTNEALLAILIHRTKILDSQYPCDENKRAIEHMERALVSFEVRTARRIARGVDGKNVV